MARFDATLKTLIEEDPLAWPRLLGVPARKVHVLDADISTISGAADKVLRLPGPPVSILHLDFQSGPDASKPCALNVYNSVLEQRHELPVRTVLVMLSPRAELTSVNGIYERGWRPTETYRFFRYELLRVWRIPAAALLGGLGTLPLAPIGAVTPGELPGLLRRMKGRLEQQADRGQIRRLWTAVYVLMGLRYEQALVDRLLQGVLNMKESVTYQAILAEGKAEGLAEGEARTRDELRKVLLALGEDRFDMPAPGWAVTALSRVDDLEQLESLARRILHVDSWADLLPGVRKTRRRKKGGA